MDTLVAEQLPLGFKASIDCKYYSVNSSNTYNYETEVKFETSNRSCNDVIAAVPQHPIMEKALVSVIQAYNRRDDLKTLCHNMTAMDEKRYRGSRNHPNPARRRGTITLSRPGLLADAVEGIYRKEKYGELKSMCGLDSPIFANMPIKTDLSDMTWLNEQAEKFYDDSELRQLSRYHFFSQQKNSIIGLTDEKHPEKIISAKRTKDKKFQEIARISCISR